MHGGGALLGAPTNGEQVMSAPVGRAPQPGTAVALSSSRMNLGDKGFSLPTSARFEEVAASSKGVEIGRSGRKARVAQSPSVQLGGRAAPFGVASSGTQLRNQAGLDALSGALSKLGVKASASEMRGLMRVAGRSARNSHFGPRTGQVEGTDERIVARKRPGKT